VSDIRSVLGGVLASGNATVVTKLNHEISANRTKVNSAHTGKSLRFVDWMGQLLLSRASQQGLSSGGKARLQEAASVVVCQAHRGVARDQEVFPEASLHDVLGLVCITKRTRNLPWASS